ncbi:preprotein translocase subunit SecE [Megalodesulfovibrio paquesii]
MANVSDTDSKKTTGSQGTQGAQSREKSARAAQSASKASRRDAARKDVESSGGLGQKVEELKDFFEEAKVELKKVTWPSRKEAQATSIAVLILTAVMAVFLGLTDMTLSKIVELILS